MVSTAVILAAGRGTRISHLVKDIPKGFIEIGGTSLIQRSLSLLFKNGIQRVIIIGGHLSEFYQKLAESDPRISVVINPLYADSGSMYSFYAAKDTVAEDFLLLESDLIYEEGAIKALQETALHSAILLSGATSSGDEVYVHAPDGNLITMSKVLEDVPSVTGELVGISKISFQLFKKIIPVAERLFQETLKVEYERCLVETAKTEEIPVLKIDGLLWAEIDDESHLRRVETTILPAIVRQNNP